MNPSEIKENKQLEAKEIQLGPCRIKAIPYDACGPGWASPCPQLYIDIKRPATSACILGSENIKRVIDICQNAISNGEGILANCRFTELKKAYEGKREGESK